MRKTASLLLLAFTLLLPRPGRADDDTSAKTLLGSGIAMIVAGGAVSMGSGGLAGAEIGNGLGEHYQPVPDWVHPMEYALCGISIGMVAAGIAMTVVGAKRHNEAKHQRVMLGAGGVGVRF
jgi:hypothetical protein